uniref:ornithine decarboxylase n=1 Tax=Jaculus jaculus TaxID=51337 RepID=A0A8C5L1K0_JACJA
MNNFNKEENDCHVLEGFTTKDILEQKINTVSSDDDKGAFYVMDLEDILKNHLRWLSALPHVTPFYAVKCNDLAAIRTGFDYASKTERQLVQSSGVPPGRIIYANPCKQMSQIKFAASSGVQMMMTFDSEIESMKVDRVHPKVKLVLRITTDDSKAVCYLSVKFGATLKTSRLLLGWAKELNIDVTGRGSGCTDPETFLQAVSEARCVYDIGAETGFSMYLLNIGGGFPGSKDVKFKFEELTSVINPALDKYFPSNHGVRIIAEPAFTLAVNIIAKKNVVKEQTGSEDELNEQTCMYYVSDGVHRSFSCIPYDHAHAKPLLQKRPKPDEQCDSSSIGGPTCDGLDQIAECYNLPEMHVCDWMLFENMGAYTVAARPTAYYVMSRPMWQLMRQVQKHGFPREVEEQDESGMDRHPAACASASISVPVPFL